MPKTRKWHPWRHLRDTYPHISVSFVDLRPLGLLGRITHHGIEIDRSSRQRERRTTLTHELCHLERGPVPRHPHFARREERTVESLTARRLIPLDALIDALAWCGGRVTDETADELWVDLDTLRTRIDTLTPRERRYVQSELDRRLRS
ncbi:hypothetical protein OED52_13905 [Rhodococcus sp. Z13]|uniref:Uncharacterized protein n=1 Tax=Rhodococcus sacchari TaxID=2962047 RepID=A0ACD4DCJ8_9NOCA|nr:ImmA/IrrE family metallo-endopeptidase [Rhodococcus sp. Z13]UYP17766.1 hypothetical protein OED52_13905 [Rhodococcus sp. Z13]